MISKTYVYGYWIGGNNIDRKSFVWSDGSAG